MGKNFVTEISKITEVLTKQNIICSLHSKTQKESILEILNNLADNFLINRQHIPDVQQSVLTREKIKSTALSGGVAIPHTKHSFISKLIIGFGYSKQGIDYFNQNGEKSHVIFLVLSPDKDPRNHLKSLFLISQLVYSKSFLDCMPSLGNQDEMFSLIKSCES